MKHQRRIGSINDLADEVRERLRWKPPTNSTCYHASTLHFDLLLSFRSFSDRNQRRIGSINDLADEVRERLRWKPPTNSTCYHASTLHFDLLLSFRSFSQFF